MGRTYREAKDHVIRRFNRDYLSELLVQCGGNVSEASRRSGVDRGIIAARFHGGLAASVAEMAADLCADNGVEIVVLSGGVFQNKLLLEAVFEHLAAAGLRVLAPEATPANDGGIALGQAAVAAARALHGPMQVN